MALALASRARLWGERPAVVDGERVWTYPDLDDLAASLAAGLAALGVGRGDAVAVLSRNRVESLALLFAVRRVGGVLAPVSHWAGHDAVEESLDRVDPAVVVHEPAQRDLTRAVPPARTRTFGELAADGNAPPDPARRDPASTLAYLHPRRRTDGPPVVASERQVEWNCIGAAAVWGLGPADRVPLWLPLFHAGGWLHAALPALYVGATLLVPHAFAPERALSAIDAHRPTRLVGTPAQFRALAAADAFDATDLSSVAWGVVAGGPVSPDVAVPFRERGVPLGRVYGRTIAGPNALYRAPDAPGVSDGTGTPGGSSALASPAHAVGVPFPDCSARVVDPERRPLPAGRTGELELRGRITARGYLGGAAFDDPWVATGDLARRERDGGYVVYGPADEAFVVDGRRVHPAEIESALLAHEGVTAAGVLPVAVDDAVAPAAVVVGDADEASLRGWLAERLPRRCTPISVQFAAALPRDAVGALDRAELSERFG